MIAISGYATDLYDTTLSNWRRVETRAFADGARPRTEVLWLNQVCATALDARSRGAGMPLFAAAK